jgi:leader peptidase (prepilin peptidase)/N-methyltransferase
MSYNELLAEMPIAYLVGAAAVFGLCIGSFLNAAIYRLPLKVSVSKPRSFCPHCKTTIQWYRNIPVVSYIMLGGRCGECKEPISIRYPLVELAVAFIFSASVWWWGLSWASLSSIIFACSMLLLALIDADHRILPNVVTLPGILVGLLLAFVNPRIVWWDAFIGAVLGGSLLYLVAWIYLKVRGQEGMGMGDVKMIAMIGAFLGWQGALMTIFLGSLIGSVVGLLLMAIKGREWDYALPFGTFLALAAVIVDWFGAELLRWYWGLFPAL